MTVFNPTKSTNPASPTGSIQFNDNGAFGGFGTWDGTSLDLGTGNLINVNILSVNGTFSSDGSAIFSDGSGNLTAVTFSGDFSPTSDLFMNGFVLHAGGGIDLEGLSIYNGDGSGLTGVIAAFASNNLGSFFTGNGQTLDVGGNALYNISTLSVGSATAPTGGVAYFNGRVGIGTASPATPLDVQGGMLRVGTGFTGGATGDLSVGRGTDGAIYLGSAGSGNIYYDGTALNFTANGTTAFRSAFGMTIGGNASAANTTTIDAVGSGRLYMFNGSAVITNFLNTGGDNYINGGNLGIGTASPGFKLDVRGMIAVGTVGNGLAIKEGTNAKMGQATLSGGTITVSTTAVTANSRIFLTDAGGTVTNLGSLYVGTITAGTSFVINSSNILDASTVNWIIIEKI